MTQRPLKAISFLGFNKRGYQETTYVNPVQLGEFKTKFVQEALVEFYQPDTLHVLLTKTAETGISDDEMEAKSRITMATLLKNQNI
ncbi:TM1812 family CRISPR-associated protein [Rivularia sp. UHCC 0363]|uniref:TM1812 family CRISPR-associated protein n=1 Tax=Rivularia sp. UHCC 0363 TaxID=3110244 RepID=UPI002B21DA7D|nr:TM1812 family CRISPR-associated protein [Rivularia sp. UHCC 0363]MEA5593488.1 TM1812 family CRISPR-associated protein [Rivularia sp. UHCC 0363]